DDWQGFLRYAGERALRETSSEVRATLRALLRHESSRVRLTAAEKYVRQRLEENAAKRPPAPSGELAAFLAEIDKVSDEELHQTLAEFIKETGFNPAQGTAP